MGEHVANVAHCDAGCKKGFGQSCHEAIDAAPLHQHVAAMSADLADLVRRRGAQPERLAEIIASAYGYRGDSDTYDDLQNADVARVIERRKGLPVALAILYLHVARAQGWDAEEGEVKNAQGTITEHQVRVRRNGQVVGTVQNATNIFSGRGPMQIAEEQRDLLRDANAYLKTISEKSSASGS